MSLRDLYAKMASLTPAQRALFARRQEERGAAGERDVYRRRWRRTGPAPLSLVQQRLWFLDQLEPGNPFYNLPLLAFHLEGELDVAALAGSLNEIERRHEALRTTFQAIDGEPRQVVAPAAVRPLPLVDLAGLPAARRERAYPRLAVEEGRRPFDLARGPLWRAALLRLGGSHHLVLIHMHHIVSDAWSLKLLLRELKSLYGALRRRLPSPLPELVVQYPDFAVWQRERLTEEVLAEKLEFWRRFLAGALFELELPTDRPRPPVQSYGGGRRALPLRPALAEDLEALCQRLGVTLYMLLLAVHSAWLYRLTGRRDLLVGSSVAGRHARGTEHLIGFFVNTVVMRTAPAGELAFDRLLEDVRQRVLDVFEHDELPFDRLVEALQPKRNRSYGPIFQTMMSLQNTEIPDLELDGLTSRPEPTHNATSQTDLILFAGARRRLLFALQLEYNTDLFTDTTMARMGAQFLALLDGILEDPRRPLVALPMLAAAERHQLLREYGGSFPYRPGVAGECLHRRFERQAAATPDAVALVGGEHRLSYGELDRRSDRLARRLRGLGVGAEVPVAICLRRDPEMVVAILAVWKAGGAYLVLDPDYPLERLAWMARDAAARVLVSRSALAPRLPDSLPRLLLDHRDNVPDDAVLPAPVVSPHNLAYVLYTSGSTGRPKGSMISHHNVARLLDTCGEVFAVSAADVWSVFHSFAFDFTVWELWGALLYGGTAVIVSEAERLDPEAFATLLERERVTLLNQTPSAFCQLGQAALPPERLARLALRTVLFGGEALDVLLLRPWLGGAPGCRFADMYGITETTVFVTWQRLAAAERAGPRGGSRIGRPLAHLSVTMRDRDLVTLPLGVAGEICVGGDGLGRGYRNAPALAAERFVPDPASLVPGARLYRSGDLARTLGEGAVEYLGRIDHQVQIRGLRIEPAEVTAVLRQHPEVRDAAVTVWTKGAAGQCLAAWVVARGEVAPEARGEATPKAPGEATPKASELRRFLATRLPEYMLPAAFTALPELPLSPNGKLDRAALPEPLPGGPERSAAPGSATEKAVARLWCELLGVSEVGIEDDFFELGGHSLLATRMVMALRQDLQADLPLKALFDNATVSGIAGFIDRADQAGRTTDEPVLARRQRRTRHRRAPVSNPAGSA